MQGTNDMSFPKLSRTLPKQFKNVKVATQETSKVGKKEI